MTQFNRQTKLMEGAMAPPLATPLLTTALTFNQIAICREFPPNHTAHDPTKMALHYLGGGGGGEEQQDGSWPSPLAVME